MNKKSLIFFSVIFVSTIFFANVAQAAVLSSTASGTMRVGDAWAVVISGLNPGETVYATGGKNGASNTSSYTADANGILSISSTHTADVIGNWQLTWTRQSGSYVGSMSFSVVAASTPVTATPPPTSTTGSSLTPYTTAPMYTGPMSGDQTVFVPIFNAYTESRNAWFRENISILANNLRAEGYDADDPVCTLPQQPIYTASLTCSIVVNGVNVPIYQQTLQVPRDSSNAYSSDSAVNYVATYISNHGGSVLIGGSGSGTTTTPPTTTSGSGSGTTVPQLSASQMAYINSLVSIVNNMAQTYKNMIGVSESTAPASTQQVSYVQNLTNVVNNMIQTYKSMLNSTNSAGN